MLGRPPAAGRSASSRSPFDRRFDADPNNQDEQDQEGDEAGDADPRGEDDRHGGEQEAGREVGEEGAPGGGTGGDLPWQPHHRPPRRR
jgi:hypothetical protein